MGKKIKIRKLLILIAAYFAALTTLLAATHDDGKNELYPYNDTPKENIVPYTTCDLGNIYIADKKTIKKIIVDNGDIYIIDERRNDNPNMCICNSYKIRSKEDIKAILKILLQYEEEDPTKWDRTFDAMYNEFIMHNVGFDFNINRVRTRNVDLDNADEENYDSPVLTFILK